MTDPIRRLAAAVVLQAVRDAQAADPALAAPARRWLAHNSTDLADVLDIPHERVRTWVQRLPSLAYEQLLLFEDSDAIE